LSIKSPIGLKDLVTAELLTDTDAETTYGAVEAVAAAISIEIKDDSGKADVQQADDAEYDRLHPPTILGFSMENADIPPSMRAKFFGHAVDANGVVVSSETDVPPYRAFGFKSEKADGTFRYVWLYKCVPVSRNAPQTYKTKPKDAVERQTSKIDWECIPTTYRKRTQVVVDDDTSAFASAKATFFSAPYVASVSGDLEITTQPLDQYLAGGAGGSLVVAASNTPSYEWYKPLTRTYAGTATAYTGHNGATLTIPTDIAAGTHFFYAKAYKAGYKDAYSEIVTVIIGA
jgi:phi13 family phage major tail protein